MPPCSASRFTRYALHALRAFIVYGSWLTVRTASCALCVASAGRDARVRPTAVMTNRNLAPLLYPCSFLATLAISHFL